MISRFLGTHKSSRRPPSTDLRAIEKKRDLEEKHKQAIEAADKKRRAERDAQLKKKYDEKKKELKSAARRTGVVAKYVGKDLGHAVKVAWKGLGQVADNLERNERNERKTTRRRAKKHTTTRQAAKRRATRKTPEKVLLIKPKTRRKIKVRKYVRHS